MLLLCHRCSGFSAVLNYPAVGVRQYHGNAKKPRSAQNTVVGDAVGQLVVSPVPADCSLRIWKDSGAAAGASRGIAALAERKIYNCRFKWSNWGCDGKTVHSDIFRAASRFIRERRKGIPWRLLQALIERIKYHFLRSMTCAVKYDVSVPRTFQRYKRDN